VPVKASPRVAAAIDIGSNSVHVLAARTARPIRHGARFTLEPLIDESDLIGLGDVVDEAGASIPVEKLQAVVGVLARQIGLAMGVGASRVVIVGTEPLRRASNADELIAAVQRYTGHVVDVLTVHQEAELTFLGVTAGSMPAEALAVVDIGGGSTEASVHVPGAELEVVALPFGSARLTNAIVSHDPPTMDELSELMAAARDVVDGAIWPEHAGASVRRAIFVGGTATNVARLGLLDRAHLNEDLSTLARMSADEVVAHYGVRPRRARQLAAGVAIVSALLDRFLLGQAEVSDASLRDGAIIAALAGGDAWLEALPALIG
jgi:exopolyphosphatase/guanosine-5'-triphosphate,3'-diphosphate pyrophosphatase